MACGNSSFPSTIAKLCGITRRITTYTGRHSFTTTVCLSKGIPIETISQMLEHSYITTIQIYARILNQKIKEEANKVSKEFNDMKEFYVQ